MSELRDQHKAFTHWYFGLRGINEANFSPEDLAWAAWKAALAQPEAEAEPVAWLHHAQVGDGGDGRTLSFSPDYYPSRASRGIGVVRKTIAVVPLYAHPPRDEWRPASEPPDTPPHDYLLKKLAMVMPLFEEARDALTAISEQQRAARCISPTLADRMDMAGTYSIDDWRDVTPPTEGAK